MEIKLRGIRVTHGERAVLDDVSFDFPPGKTTVVLGPSGCGKTTLLRIVSRLQSPAPGDVRRARCSRRGRCSPPWRRARRAPVPP